MSLHAANLNKQTQNRSLITWLRQTGPLKPETPFGFLFVKLLPIVIISYAEK